MPLEQFRELAAGYVLDDLSAEEKARVEQILLEYLALRQEVRELQEAVGMLSFDVPQIQPPDRLRAKTLGAAAGLPQGVDRSKTSPTKFWSKVVAAAAVFGAVLLGIDNLRLRQELTFAKRSDPDSVAALLQNPQSRLIALKARDTSSSAAGTLLFRKGQWQEIVLSLSNLSPLPADRVYRLWLSLDNNQTLFCGEFNTNTDGSVSVKMNPPKTPPQGVKAVGLFVTASPTSSPLEPVGTRIISGEI